MGDGRRETDVEGTIRCEERIGEMRDEGRETRDERGEEKGGRGDERSVTEAANDRRGWRRNEKG